MRLVICDDHRMFLEALNHGLARRGHEVVGSSEDLEDVVGLVAQQRPDLCVLDVDFGGRSVVQTAATVRRSDPGVGLVLLSGRATEEAWRAYDDGVIDAIVNKLCDLSVLNRAIERVGAGERVVERFGRPDSQRGVATVAERLSERERSVLALLIAGRSTEQMASALGVTRHTVRAHVQSVLRKFGVSTRAKAVNLALTLGAEAFEMSRARGGR